ncbi:MAG: phage tail protein, partial [Alphaproteobacteria bacterium]|nr:phage tail protein [Alphaproteobacteria bacterium]
GDGYSTFALPDLRGEFIRGHDNGRGIDNNRAIGSFQENMLKSHYHQLSLAVLRGMDSTNLGSLGVDNGIGSPLLAAYVPNAATQFTLYRHNGSRYSASDNQGAVWPNDGTETRPRNVALTPIIKY